MLNSGTVKSAIKDPANLSPLKGVINFNNYRQYIESLSRFACDSRPDKCTDNLTNGPCILITNCHIKIKIITNK